VTLQGGRPRISLRTRLALLYGGLFFLAGGVLLGFALFGVQETTRARRAPRLVIPVAGPHGLSDPARMVLYSGAGLVLLAGLSVGLGWLMAGRLLRPLRTITATARHISASNLHQRLALDGPEDEFTELGQTLDELFGRLESSFESQRHFVANASHELRTPLTAERALLQVTLADPDASAPTLRSACEQLLTLSEHQERLIEALLTLASSERGLSQHEPFDLAGLAGDAVAARRAQADLSDVAVSAELAPAPAAGDPSLAQSLVANLVDNAIRHNVPGGRVRVSTAAASGRSVICVANTGPVIPPGAVPRLFQPFQQLDGQRIRHADGHGLGLAIVMAIATAHGARLDAQAPPGGGLSITVSFPPPPA
jgi:signal transduction histidine kinase